MVGYFENCAKGNISEIELSSPFERLQVKVPYSEMHRELKDMYRLSISQRIGTIDLGHSTIEYEGLLAICLYGYGINETLPDSCYANSPKYLKIKKDWHLEKECPFTVSFLREFLPFQLLDRVRVQYLEPNGYLAPHRDSRRLGQLNLNMTITDNPGCLFHFENHTPFAPSAGEVYLIDVSHIHAIENASSATRISLIVTGTLDTEKVKRMMSPALNPIKEEHS